MAGLLISGPAGSGKTALALSEKEARPEAVILDFQSIYAALLGLTRGPNGRFPERQGSDAYVMPLTEYTRRVALTGALERELFPIVTNSDGSPERRSFLLGLMGPDATEKVVDPGIRIVSERLSVEGTLSPNCKEAINRWYGRLGTL